MGTEKKVTIKGVCMITIKEPIQSEIVEKKSKFIANIYYVESVDEAEDKIKEVKKKYHDARHNCSCYRVLEEGKIVEKSSDDGEPSGTAGGPMLNILQKKELVNIVVIVTRYFGGILLGTGGLVRAYSDVTQKAIEEAGYDKGVNKGEKNKAIEVAKRMKKKNIPIEEITSFPFMITVSASPPFNLTPSVNIPKAIAPAVALVTFAVKSIS